METERYPTNFRFTSDMGRFKQCVDAAKDMLDSQELFLLFGGKNNCKFSTKLDSEEYGKRYADLEFSEFRAILEDEVSVIIVQNIVEPDLEEPSLEKYLNNTGVDRDKIKEILSEKLEKRSYVKEVLMEPGMESRYWMKQESLNPKLSSLDYELNRLMFEDNTDALYATIQIYTARILEEEGMPRMFMGETDRKSVCFVCDKQDLEYMIEFLKEIKERM